jgi:hypothetical protein
MAHLGDFDDRSEICSTLFVTRIEVSAYTVPYCCRTIYSLHRAPRIRSASIILALYYTNRPSVVLRSEPMYQVLSPETGRVPPALPTASHEKVPGGDATSMDFKRKAAVCQLHAGLCELAIEFMGGL